MSSAFKNFFITFGICLVVFVFVGLQWVYPWLKGKVDIDDLGADSSQSTEESGSQETSDESSAVVVTPNQFDENGDVFTAVIMCVDSNGRALNSVFIDSNGKTKQFIYCPIASTIRSTNEVGATVPVGDLFGMMTPDVTCQAVSSMTGIETKYCLKFDRAGVRAIASGLPGASVVLNEDIIIVNPQYADYVPVAGQPYPDDYYITISNVDGRVLLNEQINGKSKLDWLLEYNPNADGSEYNALYAQIAKSVMRQFFQNENVLKSTGFMSTVIQNCETNLTLDAASGHLETIFSHDDYTYHEIAYPANWETAVTKLRKLDGSYN